MKTILQTRLKDSLVRIRQKVLRSSGSRKSEEGGFSGFQDEVVDVTRIKSDDFHLAVWDLGKCHPIVLPFLLFPSSVFVLVFSLVNPASLSNLQTWIELLGSKVILQQKLGVCLLKKRNIDPCC